MKVKTSELDGAQLDWAVGEAQGLAVIASFGPLWRSEFAPSIRWAQSGPIIEREGISLDYIGVGEDIRVQAWHATKWSTDDLVSSEDGPTPLIAAMRCYVASKLGDEVEVPEEVCGENI